MYPISIYLGLKVVPIYFGAKVSTIWVHGPFGTVKQNQFSLNPKPRCHWARGHTGHESSQHPMCQADRVLQRRGRALV